jgi:hypothetical protein
MDRHLARQLDVAAVLLAVEIDQREFLRRGMLGQVVRRDQDALRIAGPRADMPEPVDEAAVVKDAPRGVQLLAEDVVWVGHGDTSVAFRP